MRSVLVLVLLLPAIAHAEPSELVRRYTVTASDAARAGNCDVAASIGDRVKAQDPDYHAQVFVRDEAIAACIAGTPLPKPVPAIRVARPKPALHGPRIAGEFFIGAVLGAAGLILGGAIGAEAGKPQREGHDEPNWYGIFAGAGIGATLGVPVGVWAIGNSGDEQGSFLGSLAGTAVGVGLGATALWAGGDDGRAVVAAVMLPLIGGIVGFNLTRHAREPAPVGSLVVVRDGSISFGAPVVTHSNATTQVSLLSGSF